MKKSVKIEKKISKSRGNKFLRNFIIIGITVLILLFVFAMYSGKREADREDELASIWDIGILSSIGNFYESMMSSFGGSDGGSGDPCMLHPDCPNGEICKDGFCNNDGCVNDRDCPEGLSCLNNHCVQCQEFPPVAPCPEGLYCSERGFCENKYCNDDSDCEKGLHCLPPIPPEIYGTCVKCRDDNDCPSDSPACVDYECKKCDPSDNAYCYGDTPYCFVDGPEVRCVRCRWGGECPKDKPVCINNGKDNECVECKNNYDCKPPRPRCVSSNCVECEVDEDCKDGKKCINYECKDNTECQPVSIIRSDIEWDGSGDIATFCRNRGLEPGTTITYRTPSGSTTPVSCPCPI